MKTAHYKTMKNVACGSVRTIASGLAVACALMLSHPARAAEHGVTDSEIILGQSAPFTGPASHIGEQFNRGAQTYFDQINGQGGVFGRKITLVKRDDGLIPERTQMNTT